LAPLDSTHHEIFLDFLYFYFFNSNLKTHQILLYVDFLSQGPVTGQTGAVYCSNRLVNCQKPVAREIWFGNLNLSGFSVDEKKLRDQIGPFRN
jgi:hypothetical protein